MSKYDMISGRDILQDLEIVLDSWTILFQWKNQKMYIPLIML